MAQYPDDILKNLEGQVLRHKPNARPDLARDWLNWRMRSLLDRRAWAGLVHSGILSIPAAYSAGTVELQPGFSQVIGSGTGWPVADAADTTCATAIDRLGLQEVIPNSMLGIDRDSLLYVDADGTPETVAVQDASEDAFLADFKYPHVAPFKIQRSSLSGRQFRLAGLMPIFTVLSVASPEALLLDMPWGAEAVAGQPYRISQIYVTFGCEVRMILQVTDPAYGTQLAVHVPMAQLNATDPRRTSVGNSAPGWLVDNAPNANGRMTWELWPHVTSPRQLPFQVYRGWPDMRRPTDTPPPFMNSAVLVYGAIADALRTKVEPDDPYRDLRAAQDWERRFEIGAQEIVTADNAKLQSMYSWDTRRLLGSGVGAAYWQARDPDMEAGNY
jgi:hypothetical protein